MRRLVAGVLSIGVAAALGSCGGGHSSPRATGATVPSGASTTIVDVAHVPATIDTAYVQHVMDALDQVLGDAIRVFVANKGPNQQFIDLLSAIYDEPQYSREVQHYGRVAAANLQGYNDHPGNPVTMVTKLVGVSATCVVLSASRDFGPAYTQQPPADTLAVYVQLQPKNIARDPRKHNPTAWMIVADGKTANGREPVSPCK